MNTPTVPTPAVTGPTRVAHSTAPASRGASRAWPGRTRILTSDSAWAAAAAAVLILIAGAMTLATGHPWLFAALGPTAVTVASSPGHPTSRFHSIVVGHATAFVCAWLVVLLVGAADAPIGSGAAVTVARVWGSAMAIAATTLVQPTLRAYHPPAAATALLITLGQYHVTWKSSLGMMAGVLVVALAGEWLQRIRLKDEPNRR